MSAVRIDFPEAPVTKQLEAMTHLASRTLRKDAVGRENPEWARMHERINELLDELLGTTTDA